MRIPRGDDLAAYDEAFFADHLANAGFFTHFASVLRGLLIAPDRCRVVDVGCGHGLLVEALRSAGLSESWGLEGSAAAERIWPPQWRDAYRLVDLRDTTAASSAMPPTELVCCLEVAEHLPLASAAGLLGVLTTHRPGLVLFGAASWLQDLDRNPTHVNEQGPGFWIAAFRELGYVVDVPTTVAFRNALLLGCDQTHANWWTPKNLLLFQPAAAPSVALPYQPAELDPGQPPLLEIIRPFNTADMDPLDAQAAELMHRRDQCDYMLLVNRHIARRRHELSL
ncbi:MULTISPECIES: methyltransferase domain-containing protein [Aphanothece]|uniref:methyltransferase domain-containing protein n=1 Tax=Aphanothece TaxID=1121 RepID=UPI0039852358